MSDEPRKRYCTICFAEMEPEPHIPYEKYSPLWWFEVNRWQCVNGHPLWKQVDELNNISPLPPNTKGIVVNNSEDGVTVEPIIEE